MNFLHVVLGYMYKLAQRWKVPAAENYPLESIPHFKANDARERYLTSAEIERVKAAVEASPNPQLRFIIPLLLLTGVRKRELLDAKWEHFDLDQRRWRVPHTKSGKPRFVPLSQAAIDILSNLPRWKGCPFVVPSPETLKPYKDIFHIWNKARIEAGVPDCRIHDIPSYGRQPHGVLQAIALRGRPDSRTSARVHDPAIRPFESGIAAFRRRCRGGSNGH